MKNQIKFPKPIKTVESKYEKMLRYRAKSKSKPKKVKKIKIKRIKLVPLPKLKKKLWNLFATFIKNRDGNTCISCGRTGLISGRGGSLHAGHFLTMNVCNFKYKYDERNVNSQCAFCNCMLHGNYVEYRKAMIIKYGEEVVLKMEDEYRQPLEMNFNEREYLEFLIEKYS